MPMRFKYVNARDRLPQASSPFFPATSTALVGLWTIVATCHGRCPLAVSLLQPLVCV